MKQQIVESIRSSVENFKSIYVFSIQNMRNEKMKEVRTEWKPSKFYFGKNKVVALALGRNKEEEIEDDLHHIAENLKGQCGILFTNKPKDEVIEWFKEFGVGDYARSGFKAKETISLPAGPLEDFSHAMEPYLRQLGLPTTLERGVVTLLKDYEICKAGNVLTPEQAKILKLLDNKLAKFKLNIRCYWVKKEGFSEITQEDEESDQETEQNENDDKMEEDED